MTTKVFISQPMKGKSEEEILAEREKMIKGVKALYNDDIKIIDSYIPGEPTTENSALFKLGQSLQMLSDANLAVFAFGWQYARGYVIERLAADMYGIEILDCNK